MMRFRHLFLFLGALVVVGLLMATDPDKGVSTGLYLLGLASGIVAVTLAHWGRKALHDYPEADARQLFAKAGQTSVGAGLALVALALVLNGLLGLFGRAAHAQDVATYIHPRAEALRPVIAGEIKAHWPDIPRAHYVPALIDHESCLSMRHSRCWSPTSRLLSQREEGAGLGQITRTWNKDGALRFDSLSAMRDRHPALSEWSWSNVYQRPDLQIRGIVLMLRDNFNGLRMVADPHERMVFALPAYNGGLGGVQQERRACGLVAGCDPQKWFGHVEKHCLKSKTPLYGSRSACDINRTHARDVVFVRAPKFEGWL